MCLFHWGEISSHLDALIEGRFAKLGSRLAHIHEQEIGLRVGCLVAHLIERIDCEIPHATIFFAFVEHTVRVIQRRDRGCGSQDIHAS